MDVPDASGSPAIRSRLAPSWQRPCSAAIDAASLFTAGLLAFALRYDSTTSPHVWPQLASALPVWVIAKSAVFHMMHVERGCWNYCSLFDVKRLALANVVGSALSLCVIVLVAPVGLPISLYLLDLLLCTQITGGTRILSRLLSQDWETTPAERRLTAVCIYGAGNAGIALLRELRSNGKLGYDVRGFCDDNPQKVGTLLEGVEVLGTGNDLAWIAAKYEVEEVLIAIPSSSGEALTKIVQRCRAGALPCKTIPTLADIIQGQGLASQIRDVAVEDLLGRQPVRLEESAIHAKLQDRVVLVTGAAGSIGSELCRQIARFRPKAIVGFEISETGLFDLELEMRRTFPDVRFEPEIGSVQRIRRLKEALRLHRPSVLYHAAAYKHVPLMESHVFEAVENNILGTYNVARAAAAFGVHDVVLISSDKAVHPTSIMGVTKRVAEQVMTSMPRGSRTKFVSVRFGNVLGSNGSVVPLFKRQIAAGGPVTVTHPQMRRYFMSIPEAVQLVLEASTMRAGGEIFVLDMGEPVSIVELAENLIALSGLRPGRDIAVKFVGVRPGEKLCEELNTVDERTRPTYHEKIKIFVGPTPGPMEVGRRIQALRELCATRDLRGLLELLCEMVPQYSPSDAVLRRLMGSPDTAAHAPVASLRHDARSRSTSHAHHE